MVTPTNRLEGASSPGSPAADAGGQTTGVTLTELARGRSRLAPPPFGDRADRPRPPTLRRIAARRATTFRFQS